MDATVNSRVTSKIIKIQINKRSRIYPAEEGGNGGKKRRTNGTNFEAAVCYTYVQSHQ